MKKMLMTIALLSITTISAQAGISEELRPYSMKFFGSEWTVKIFGKVDDKIKLPQIPKIVRDVKSIKKDVVDSKELKITPENRQKYNYLYVRDIFQVTRNIAANENDISKWMNVMGQGASREGIYRALVLDNVYSGLENFDHSVKPAVSTFTMKFLEGYANKVVSKESLDKANFYTLKRVLVERTLEVFDALSEKPEMLYDWYAVISSDMAKNYKGVWVNKVRSSTSRELHRRWATKVPIQYIKGEVIIKLHRISNYLNN